MDTSRISGIASGMDTEQMVKDLMKAQRVKVDRLYQQKQIHEWRQNMYNDINKSFANFILDTKKEFGLTTTTSTGLMLNKSLDSLPWVKQATSSNESIASVTARASAVNGSYDVDVKRLADGVSMASGSNISVGDKGNVAEQFGLASGDTIEFTITTDAGSKTFKFGNVDGADIKKDLSDIGLKDIVKTVNSATITKDGKEIDLGVKASYDSNIDRFFLQTDGTGKDSSIKIDDTSGFVDKLKLNVTHYDASGVKQEAQLFVSGQEYTGVNAKLDFAGAIGVEQSSNQFNINGISFDLNATGSFSVKVDTDVDNVYDKIKGFIEKYNEIVDAMGEKLGEEKYRSYKPLTDEQKESMKEKDIELWEKKAKSGLLRNDMLISRTMQRVRSGLYDSVEGVKGTFDHLTELGITTQKYVSGEVGGKLQIDETKLKEAIQKDAQGVLEVLFKQPDSDLTDDKEIAKNSGIITRVYNNMMYGMKEIVNKSGTGEDANLLRNVESNLLIDFVTEHGSISMLDEEINDLDDKIYDMNRYLYRKEESYWQRFTAMEKAIARMNSQSSWLTQQMG
ncbi:flagellar filament capping protein FliD [Clostridiisalibacter paucivorans]|uniref:flagellar filament capping protein FliD n=1 Tax=Clostridiisalibacter paucivorans TaxID=408753 RepID=UPI0004795143|nr:flagellar filament capping protein FliD [Clostridiisalibacter paucivorans]